MADFSRDPWAAYNTNYANVTARGQAQQANIDNMLNARAAKDAGVALGSGDYKGAANALYKRGNVDAGLKVQDYGQAQDKAKREQQITVLGRAAKALRDIPDPQARMGVLQSQIAPALQSVGVGPDVISQIAHSDLSDQSLDAFMTTLGQEAEKLQIVASGGGGYNAVDPRKGRVVYSQAPSVIDPTKTYLDYGNGQPPPAAPGGTPAPATAPAANPAQAGGDAYLSRLGQIESSNNPNAKNGSSTGLYQFHPDTFARLGGTDINDPAQQKAAALKLARESAQQLQQANLPVDDASLYIMHQQGSGGGLALLTAPPEVNAVAALTPVYGNPTRARQAIVNNGGTPDMTAGQFIDMWRQKWGQGTTQAAAQPAAQPYQVASNGETPPPPSNADNSAGLNLPAGARVIHAATPKPTARPATAAEKAQYGIPADTPAQMKPDGSIDIINVQQGDAPTPGNANLSGDAYLSTLPAAMRSQVKALTDGRMAFPTGAALKSPYWQERLSAVAQYDPNFDAVNYNARSKTRAWATSGAGGAVINSLNTAIGHLVTLKEAGEALHNTGLPDINKGKNWLESNKLGDPRVKNFNIAKNAVADELSRAFRLSGATEGEVNAWKQQFDASGSPQQLQGAIDKAIELLNSRLDAVGVQYSQGMGTTKDPLELLSPHSLQQLRKLEGSDPTVPAAKAGALPPQAAQQLKPDHITTFANGQSWTLRNGKPVRVK